VDVEDTPFDPDSVDIPPRPKVVTDTTIKVYRSAFDDFIWPKLVKEFNWRLEPGNRPNDKYFMPPGVLRGRHGFTNRKDFFDSSKQVLTKLIREEEKFGEMLTEVRGVALCCTQIFLRYPW
jgi:hypothetical protein